MKKYIRIVVDVILLVLFIVLMGYHITGNNVHEILGVITFVFFLCHHLLNIKWYKTIFKGKHSFYRGLQITINMFLLLAIMGIVISSVMISSNVFSFLNIKTTMFGRNLHLASTSWSFILMGIHLGFHLNMILLKMNKKMKNSSFEYVYYLIIALLMIAGVFFFFDTEIWKDMFLVSEFKFFDYNQKPYLFYIGEFSIICFISFLTSLLLKLKKQ